VTQLPADAMSPDVAKPYADTSKIDGLNGVKFIEVNGVSPEEKVAINIDRIISIKRSDDGGATLMCDGIEIEVKETYESLIAAIKN
jgi:hypothetical protein